MSRLQLTFPCEGAQLAGSLDTGDASSGLLLISGGNEIRSGAFAGQAHFAARIAEQGFPVFRFDRRGTGDSQGPNGEFQTSGPDIAAALCAFRAQCPQLNRIVGFGNCDAASALMLAHGEGLDALILSNPWTFEDSGEDVKAAPDFARDHYRKRLTNPAAIKRLLTGKVSIKKLIGGLLGAVRSPPPLNSLVQDMAAGIEGFPGAITFLVAERDRTGTSFIAAWDKADPRIRKCADATHAYVEPDARAWLEQQVLETLKG
ncbi:MAG: hydrolase 1, exosortase A system-associated [Sphingomonadaceae bacterium]|nr:hydrolase 1, exosortase A system-associated [Sphingomonadaceae bacterium]